MFTRLLRRRMQRHVELLLAIRQSQVRQHLGYRPPAAPVRLRVSPSRHPPFAQLASLRRSENLLAARLGEAEGRASQLVAANAMLKKQIEVWKARSSSVTTANAAAQQWGHRGSVRGVSPVTAPAAAPAGTDPAASARAQSRGENVRAKTAP